MDAREIQIPEDILGLALAFYREPTRYQHLLSARMARDEGVQILLRAAIGTGSDVSRELRNAALFAIEQFFFAQGANYYQILGLTSDANIGQVKLHHRLLMRLLHPDRSDARQTWLDAYAGRVNQAYNVLRKSASRQAYDSTLESLQHDRVSSQAHRDCGGAPSIPKRLALVPPKSCQPPASGLIKHFPQLVLSVVAVLALLFVIWSYLANRTFFVAVRTEVVLADSARVVAPLLDFDSLSRDEKPDPSVQDPNQHQQIGVSVNDLKALMGRFTETYNQGDLAGFMTLFDERARTGSHYGKPAIRKDYEGFFSITASRRLILNDLKWHREGVIASGRGGFQVRVRMRDGRTVHDSRGAIRFEVRKHGAAVSIQGVYHEMN